VGRSFQEYSNMILVTVLDEMNYLFLMFYHFVLKSIKNKFGVTGLWYGGRNAYAKN
jgi:hypothetical protein